MPNLTLKSLITYLTSETDIKLEDEKNVDIEFPIKVHNSINY